MKSLKKHLIIGSVIVISSLTIAIPSIVASTNNVENQLDQNLNQNQSQISQMQRVNNIVPLFNGNIDSVSNQNLNVSNFHLSQPSTNPNIDFKITSAIPSPNINQVEITYEGFFINNSSIPPIIFKTVISGFLFTSQQALNFIQLNRPIPKIISSAQNKLPSQLVSSDLINPELNNNLFANALPSFSFSLSTPNSSDDIFGDTYGRSVSIVASVQNPITGVTNQVSYRVILKNSVVDYMNDIIYNNNLTGTLNGSVNSIVRANLNAGINPSIMLSSQVSPEDFSILPYVQNVNSQSITINQSIALITPISSTNNVQGQLILNINVTADLSSLSLNSIQGPSNYSFSFQQVVGGFLQNNSIIQNGITMIEDEIRNNPNGLSSLLSPSSISLVNSNQLVNTEWNVNSFQINPNNASITRSINIGSTTTNVTYNFQILNVTPINSSNSATLSIGIIPTNLEGINISPTVIGNIVFNGSITSVEQANQQKELNQLIDLALVPQFRANSSNPNINLNSLASANQSLLNQPGTNINNFFTITPPASSNATFSVLRINSVNDLNGSMNLEIQVRVGTLVGTYNATFFGFITTSTFVQNQVQQLINQSSQSLKNPLFLAGNQVQSSVSVQNVQNSDLNLNSQFANSISTIFSNLNQQFTLSIEIGTSAFDRNTVLGQISGMVNIISSNLNFTISYPFTIGGFQSTAAQNQVILQTALQNLPTPTLTQAAINSVVVPGLINLNDFQLVTSSTPNVTVTYLNISNPDPINGTLNLEIQLSIPNTGDLPPSTLNSTLTIRNLPTIQNYLNFLSNNVNPTLNANISNTNNLLPSQIPTGTQGSVNFPGTTDPIFSLQTNNINFIPNLFNSIQYRITNVVGNDLTGSAIVSIQLFVTNTNVPGLSNGVTLVSSVYQQQFIANSFLSNPSVINMALNELNALVAQDPNRFINFNGNKLIVNPSLITNASQFSLDISSLNNFSNPFNVNFSLSLRPITLENTTNGTVSFNLIGSRSLGTSFAATITSTTVITVSGFETDVQSVSRALTQLSNSQNTSTPQVIFNGNLSTGGTGSLGTTSVNQININSFSFSFNNTTLTSPAVNPLNQVSYSIINFAPNAQNGSVVLTISLTKGNAPAQTVQITITGFQV